MAEGSIDWPKQSPKETKNTISINICEMNLNTPHLIGTSAPVRWMPGAEQPHGAGDPLRDVGDSNQTAAAFFQCLGETCGFRCGFHVVQRIPMVSHVELRETRGFPWCPILSKVLRVAFQFFLFFVNRPSSHLSQGNQPCGNCSVFGLSGRFSLL